MFSIMLQASGEAQKNWLLHDLIHPSWVVPRAVIVPVNDMARHRSIPWEHVSFTHTGSTSPIFWHESHSKAWPEMKLLLYEIFESVYVVVWILPIHCFLLKVPLVNNLLNQKWNDFDYTRDISIRRRTLYPLEWTTSSFWVDRSRLFWNFWDNTTTPKSNFIKISSLQMWCYLSLISAGRLQRMHKVWQ